MRQRLPIVLSVTALIVALLGWTGIAESTIDRLITSKDIKNSSIRSIDIRNGTVTGGDVKNRSLTGADIRDGTLRARDFRPGELVEGAPGPRGPKGDVGPAVGVATQGGGRYNNVRAINPSKTITAPVAGDLFVFGRVSAFVTCGASNCNRHYELYVDGETVRGTLVEVHGPANELVRDGVAVFGVVPVDAGDHVVQLYAGNNPSVKSHLDVSTNVGAILLGD